MQTFYCESCGHRMACSDDTAGLVVRCGRCHGLVIGSSELPKVAVYLERPRLPRRSPAHRLIIGFWLTFVILVIVGSLAFQLHRFDPHRRDLDKQFSTMTDQLEEEREIIRTNGFFTQPKYKQEYIIALEESVKSRNEYLVKFVRDYQQRYGEKPLYIKPADR